MIPAEKVEAIVSKHNSIEKELSSGNVDPKNFADKSKEYSELGIILKNAIGYLNFENEKKDLENIINDEKSDNEMINLAVKSVKKNHLKTKILGVTLLTSLDGKDSKKIFGEGNTKKLVKKYAEIANKSGIHGLICSGEELIALKKFNKLIKITPGVKLFTRNDDQKRVTFAHNAIENGASFVVIGRELIENKEPLNLLKKYAEQHKNKNLWTK